MSSSISPSKFLFPSPPLEAPSDPIKTLPSGIVGKPLLDVEGTPFTTGEPEPDLERGFSRSFSCLALDTDNSF